MVDVSKLISKIEINLTNYVNVYHIIAGDFNFECRADVNSYCLFKDLLDRYKLFNCDSCNSSQLNCIYYHENLGHFSWIDHVFVSENLRSLVKDVVIIASGENLPDHLRYFFTLS